MNFEYIGDRKFGIIAYRNALGKELRLPERLEETIGNSTQAPFMWMDALVGYGQKMPEYRDCVDCKISNEHIKHLPDEFSEMKNIYEDTKNGLIPCLQDYQSKYNISMNFMEAINYVRYRENQHFNVHSDHGFSYVCTVSSVMYLNDEYEGGELWFPYLEMSFKPTYGDIILFPSTFIYAHASKPVTKGTKYAAVTMFDYNDTFHDYTDKKNPYDATPNY
jgi:prolyl 4-hydroxylase